jgi:hypothetical protein
MALLAHFRFEGNTDNRFSGYQNTATNITYTTQGKINSAGIFVDGSFATFTSTFFLNQGVTWTVSVWVKTTAGGTQSILSNSSGGPVFNDLRIENGKIVYEHYNNAWLKETGTITVNDGQWHNLVWVNFSNAKMNMYVDGILDRNQVDSALSSAGAINRIGRNWANNNFIGTMDDLRIYDDADLGKITSLNFNEKLVGHFPFTGNSNNFVSGGSSLTTVNSGGYTTGKIGQAINIVSGSGSTTITPSNFGLNLNSSAWTFSMWAKPNKSLWDSIADRFTFFEMGSYYSLNETSITIQRHIVTAPNKNRIYMIIYTNQTQPYAGSLDFTNTDLNNWIYISVTYDGNNKLEMHTVGVESGYRKITSTNGWNKVLNPIRDNIFIGGYGWATSDWRSTINDVRLYNYALSEYEVKELAKAKVLHYTFDDPNEEPTVNLAAPIFNFSGMGYGLTYTYTGIDSEGWHRWSISGTGTSNTYPYTINITPSNILLSTRTSFSFKYKTNVNNKYVGGFRDPRMVNITYAAGFNSSDIDTGVYREAKIQNVSPASGAESQSQPIYFLSRPQNGVTFNPATDFVYFKDVQAERKPYATPFTIGTRNIGIADLSGLKYNNFPTTTITPRWSSTSKLGSNSILFNGAASNHLNLTEISAMPLNTGMSFSVWAYPTASSNWARFMDFGNGAPSNNILFTRQSTSATIHLESFNGTSSTTVTSTNAIENNVWQHFAFTIASNGATKIYKNGSVIASGTLNVPNVITRNNMYIGRSNWVSDAFYNGHMDDIRLYTTALSDADILSLYNRRANFDNLGNVSINEIDNTRSYFPSSVDYSTWTVGQTSATGWSRNGTTSENIILLKENPVNQTDIMWATLGNDTASNDDGGFNGSSVPVDKTKKYRFSLWIKRENIGNGRTYFGCAWNTVSNLGAGEVLNGNPYFTNYISSEKSNIGEQWVLIIAHVHPTGYTGGTDTVSGFYDVNGNKISSISTDYKWLTTTTTSLTRAYLFYSTSTTERQYFYRPRIDLLDGNEPSLQDLINCSDNPVLYEKTVADINKKALFNNNGQALFRDIDEVSGTQNTGAQQEITNNGTLLINGEFSEVD